MKITVKVSDKMSNNSVLGELENRLIRIPRLLRNKLGIIQGVYLDFPDKTGNKLWLQVATAYEEDASNDDLCVYVSQSTKDLLNTKQKSSIAPANDILIGCDPEFFLVDKNTGERVSASHFFPHYGEIGSDFYLAELRPRPYMQSANIVDELEKLFKKAYIHIQNRQLYKRKDIHLIAVSNYRGASAGFHVHFGLPYVFLKQTDRQRGLMRSIAAVLDYYVGISAMLPEGEVDFVRRVEGRGGYGRPGDFRSDRITLEYRVPGAHLLRHPLLSNGLLSMSIVVMKDILSRFQAYTDNYKRDLDLVRYEDVKKIYPSLPSQQDVYNTITSRSIKPALGHLDKILSNYTKMFGYKDNSRAIVDYFSYILNHVVKGEYFDNNIEKNWRLDTNEGQQKQMAVLRASI